MKKLDVKKKKYFFLKVCDLESFGSESVIVLLYTKILGSNSGIL